MPNDNQVLDPEMAAMLDTLDEDAVGASASTETEGEVLHAEQPAEQAAAPEVPLSPAVPVVSASAENAPDKHEDHGADHPGMTPAIEDANLKRAALIDASKAVLTTLYGPDGQSGVTKVVRKMNAGLDGARVALGSSFGSPKDTLERLMQGDVIETITPSMFRDLRSGKAFEFPVLEDLASQVATMRALHEAWTAAIRKASGDVQAHRAATRGRVIDPVITRCLELPLQFRDANNGDLALGRDLKKLRNEISALGAFAEAYEKALSGDWSTLESWISDHKVAFAKAMTVADAVTDSAMLTEQKAVPDEQDPQAVADEQRKVEVEVEVDVPPSDDDVILTASDLEEAVNAAPIPALRAGFKLRDVQVVPPEDVRHGEPTFIDRATGEVIEPTLAEVEAAIKGAEEFSWKDPKNADALFHAGLLAEFAAEHLLAHDPKKQFHFRKDAELFILGSADAERARADAMGDDAADAMPDGDPMEDHRPSPVTRVSHASDAIAPGRDDASGFNPVALVQKHFYPIAGGAAVLVLGLMFMIGHGHRKDALPAVPDVPAAPMVQAPAPAPAVPPVVASTPAVSPAPTASAPVVATPAPAPVMPPPAAASAPVVASPAAPVSQPAPVKPAAAEHVAKPEVRKPARPVVHEHVTTMRDTNQALDQLRAKLGE